jgi:hypothetical protein
MPEDVEKRVPGAPAFLRRGDERRLPGGIVPNGAICTYGVS